MNPLGSPQAPLLCIPCLIKLGYNPEARIRLIPSFPRPCFKISEAINSFFPPLSVIHLCWISALYNQKVLIHYQYFKMHCFFQKDHQGTTPNLQKRSPGQGICYFLISVPDDQVNWGNTSLD